MTLVIVEDIVKKYGGKVAVDGVSFSVGEGEVFGLIGPNGAGKTTTLRIISSLVKPDAGRVVIKGVDVHKEPVKAREMISYLPEEAEVYPRLTGYEHIKLYTWLKLGHVDEETIKRGVEFSGLGSRLNDRAGDYSKGMKRRLLLAVTLMTMPKLAILDEPTSGLDVYAAVNVRKIIRRFVEETGSSVILSSHNMLEVEYLCDRIAFINKGRIIAVGTPDEIKSRFGGKNLEEAFINAVEESSQKI